MTWSFFGTWHGKGEWDGARAVVKCVLRNEQIHNPERRLQNVKNCVQIFTNTMSSRVPSSYESS
jgi:hypothetical protein